MLNKVILAGRIGSEMRENTTKSGNKVVSLFLIVDHPYDSKSDGFTITVFDGSKSNPNMASNLIKYNHVGDMISVTAKLQNGTVYENKDGQTMRPDELIAQEVDYLSTAKGNRKDTTNNGQNNAPQGNPQPEAPQDPFNQAGDQIDISDDDLPF